KPSGAQHSGVSGEIHFNDPHGAGTRPGYAKGLIGVEFLIRENHSKADLLLTEHPVPPYNNASPLVLCCSCRRSRTGSTHMKHTQTYRCLHALLMSCLQT